MRWLIKYDLIIFNIATSVFLSSLVSLPRILTCFQVVESLL